jgi:hypothetical protein
MTGRLPLHDTTAVAGQALTQEERCSAQVLSQVKQNSERSK